MKKSLSFILALTMISSCLALAGCNNEEQLGYFKEQKIKKDYISQFDISDVTANDVVLDYYGGNYNGYEIVMLDTECHDPETRVEQIGDSSITYYDSNQLYAWKNGNFYTLDSAYEAAVLTDLELRELVLRFNNEVKHFRDTGDRHDYEPTESTPLPEDYFMYTKYFSKYSLKVTLDKKASIGNVTPPIEFFGSQYISRIRNLSKNQDVSNEDFEQKLEVYLHTENSILNLLYVKAQLEKIPGVKKVELYGLAVIIRNANDTYYVNIEDEDYQWGLDSIDVSSVWDFSTIRTSYPSCNNLFLIKITPHLAG